MYFQTHFFFIFGLTGTGMGCTTACFSLIAGILFGSRNVSRVFGSALLFAGLSSFFVPLIAGIAYTVTPLTPTPGRDTYQEI